MTEAHDIEGKSKRFERAPPANGIQCEDTNQEPLMQTDLMKLAEREDAYGVRPSTRPTLLRWDGATPVPFDLERGRTLIGAAPGCGVHLPERYVSRHHAQLICDGPTLSLRDTGSRNGVFVDGRRVKSGRLCAGATLRVGGARFVVVERLEAGGGAPCYRLGGWIGAGRGALALFHQVMTLADHDEPVLISGETGSGKEVAARLLHLTSSRRASPFNALNCASLEPGTADSELFGHCEGAFTGARGDRLGMFLATRDGSLLLDEIGETRTDTQAKLLRVLERRELRRLGEDQVRPCGCRVLAATHRDLEQLVAQERFREDLLHRLSVYTLRLPPLRTRRGDVAPLARHHLSDKGLWIDPGAITLLERHDWPGNVRELLHTLDRAAAITGADVVTAREVRASLRTPRGAGAQLSLEDPDVARAVRRAVAEEGVSLRKALARAGVARSTYYDHIKRGVYPAVL
jgi:two-component system, NtrC family, nitrogen regulation response regulator GlnG